MRHLETFVLPSVWASYLINGDASGLTDSYPVGDGGTDVTERDIVDQWLEWSDLSRDGFVDCEHDGFVRVHDAYEFLPYGADCQRFTYVARG